VGVERATPEWWREEPRVQRTVDREEGCGSRSAFFFGLLLLFLIAVSWAVVISFGDTCDFLSTGCLRFVILSVVAM